MTFIRKKRVGDSTYLYVVSNTRRGTKVIQTAKYIGKENQLPQLLSNCAIANAITSEKLQNLLYQTPVSLWKLMEEMSFQKIISDHFKEKEWGIRAATAACVMILNYATDRHSKCRLADWYEQTHLPHLLHIPAQKMNKDLLCRSMDQFTEKNIYNIHAEIFKTANEKYHFSDDYLFYDTTAVTFEGRGCDLAERSYNAAHSHNPQINIGLATTKERFPVMHKVFDGSTKDVSTFAEVMPLLEKTGNLEKTIFIVDRGITSTTNINLIKSKKANFIFGKPKDRKVSAMISSLKEENFSKFVGKEMTEDENEMSFYETTHGEDRLVVYWSKKLQGDNLKHREKKLKLITESLEKLVKNVDKYTEQKLFEKIGITCGKTYRNFFDITFADKKLTFSLKPAQIDLANKTEGRYAILTNTELTPLEVLRRYRSRNFVEMSFKDLKLFVNIGPSRHWKDRRVVAHVFLAILAMALRSVLELKLRVDYPFMTSEEALLKLNCVRALVSNGKILKITGETDETRKIVTVLEKPYCFQPPIK